MAFEKRPATTDRMKKPKPGSLADAHGKGINAESSHDLTGHVAAPLPNEGKVGSQGWPQPSGGATGMRGQLGSFESGQSDLDSGIRGEDKRSDEQARPGVNPGQRKPHDE